MDVQIGIRGKDFVLLLSDKSVVHSIVQMKHNQDKMKRLNEHNIMSTTGEPGDVDSFSEYVEANIKLFGLRQERPLSTSDCAHWVRGTLAESLRSRSPYNVNILIGGYDPLAKKASLYRIDYLSSIIETKYACHGYPSYFSYALLDKEYHNDISAEDAIKLATKCVNQLEHRFLVNHPGFLVRVIDSEGMHTFDSQASYSEDGKRREFKFVNTATGAIVAIEAAA
ncbi:Proteasome subunit beta type-4 [Spiromyces aspiralis]|uniref:Proteasome subunit beta type-4 n=1 Tax=Spiromyces aspiralis TaxID=68401 RepID=A0ACC1HYC1_9FUNG|nr:Proteasome subunit beta type-4 [Spiromyces aspiralis]